MQFLESQAAAMTQMEVRRVVGRKLLQVPQFLTVKYGYTHISLYFLQQRNKAMGGGDHKGFCCSCNLFGGETVRGIGECPILGSGQQSAHCLSFAVDPLWYSGYSIGPCETFFQIGITVLRTNDNSTQIQETVSISPQNTGATTQDGKIVVRLIGDLVSYQDAPDLNNLYYFCPSSPQTDPRVKNYLKNSMLIPQSAVTLTGQDCDKIGVSYYAFRYQSQACLKPVGACLSNQLEDFHNTGLKISLNDMALFEQNKQKKEILFKCHWDTSNPLRQKFIIFFFKKKKKEWSLPFFTIGLVYKTNQK
ncbi:hypothetical protein RFI_14326 [Reticulomyxa filosa]|uniref:Generative cell specific-1/HAP2 domain-containing protein n=1 Tax=Reticulomyxa filosa TaxID=46433 RepID=X6N9B2_RETFI|nr:hypothetical protein RFI_14326 [Reticulomyxa filosa]|eukprot:ETO22865.1 hypothetical protein RFI_14326 [Reticulomyxa filosa]